MVHQKKKFNCIRVDILMELGVCQPVLLTRYLRVDVELMYLWLYRGVCNMK